MLEEVLLTLTLNGLREQNGEANAENSCTSFIQTKEYVMQKTHLAVCLSSIYILTSWDNKKFIFFYVVRIILIQMVISSMNFSTCVFHVPIVKD